MIYISSGCRASFYDEFSLSQLKCPITMPWLCWNLEDEFALKEQVEWNDIHPASWRVQGLENILVDLMSFEEADTSRIVTKSSQHHLLAGYNHIRALRRGVEICRPLMLSEDRSAELLAFD